MGVMPSTDSIAWLDWGADTFARATAEQKPILLFIGTAWCRWTAEMDRFSYRDPRVVRLVADRFLPVRVDAERRPDVSARYTLDGWPTTAFLTPDGDLLGGGTHLDADALTAVLADVAEAFARQRADIDVRAAAGRIAVPGKADPGGSVDPDEGATARRSSSTTGWPALTMWPPTCGSWCPRPASRWPTARWTRALWNRW